jgi:hypothetical protein
MERAANTERPSGPSLAKERARALYATGEYSQRDIAKIVGHAQPVIQRWVKGIQRAAPPVEELSADAAASLAGIPRDSILAACKDGRLGRFGEHRYTGHPGAREHWIITREELEAFLATLLPCRFPGCSERGTTPDGFCGRAHATSMMTKEKHENRVDGLHRYYDSPASEPLRAARTEQAKLWWQTGTGLAPAILNRRDKRRAKGRTRQIYFGRWAPVGGRPRNDARPDYEDALERIRRAYEETHASERDLERLTGDSRRMVRIARSVAVTAASRGF